MITILKSPAIQAWAEEPAVNIALRFIAPARTNTSDEMRVWLDYCDSELDSEEVKRSYRLDECSETYQLTAMRAKVKDDDWRIQKRPLETCKAIVKALSGAKLRTTLPPCER